VFQVTLASNALWLPRSCRILILAPICSPIRFAWLQLEPSWLTLGSWQLSKNNCKAICIFSCMELAPNGGENFIAFNAASRGTCITHSHS